MWTSRNGTGRHFVFALALVGLCSVLPDALRAGRWAGLEPKVPSRDASYRPTRSAWLWPFAHLECLFLECREVWSALRETEECLECTWKECPKP